ncbi:MAG: hypothetical protein ACYC8T_28545 [Myxococcaceae bacterium]
MENEPDAGRVIWAFVGFGAGVLWVLLTETGLVLKSVLGRRMPRAQLVGWRLAIAGFLGGAGCLLMSLLVHRGGGVGLALSFAGHIWTSVVTAHFVIWTVLGLAGALWRTARSSSFVTGLLVATAVPVAGGWIAAVSIARHAIGGGQQLIHSRRTERSTHGC